MLRILIPLAGVSNATRCLIASRTCWEPKMVVFHVLTPKYYAKLEIYQKWSMINCNLIGPSCDIFLLLQIDFKCKKRLKCCLITSRTRWESKWWIFILSHENNNLMEIFFTIIVPHLAWLTPIISWHFGQHGCIGLKRCLIASGTRWGWWFLPHRTPKIFFSQIFFLHGHIYWKTGENKS